jgi:hypothetical protein
MAYMDPNSPPGPVGIGPGYWKWDGNGGGWRSDWVSGFGGFKISGEGVDPNIYGAEVAARDYSAAGANPAAGAAYYASPTGISVAPATAPMVNQPTSDSTRSVLGADQDQANPWDPTLVRRNQYDVGY